MNPHTLLWVKDSGYAQESVRYSSGLIDFQTVLDTQRTQLRTQESVAITRIALSENHVRLYKALGGGWQPDHRAATPTQDAPQATRS